MTHAPDDQSTMPGGDNPYVGPRTFTEKEGRFFFGREREARDLTARIVSERLLLFYAQSGAGKSSLLNARVIPKLRDEERFQVLPVGRVSGELPAGVAQVDNIYAFNLMTSLDQSDVDPARLAIRREGMEVILHEIDQLPPWHRNVVLLIDVHGYDYAEAAELLSLPLGTVKSRLSRARAALRDALIAQDMIPASMN